MNNNMSLRILSTSKFVAQKSDYPYCSRFDSMMPPNDFFPPHEEMRLEDEAQELAEALSCYKQIHHRSCLSFQEIIYLLRSLGYKK